MRNRAILWDFDGTLAERPGSWSKCLCEALEANDGAFAPEDFAPHLTSGFPWHTPEVAHPDLSDAETWWEHVGTLLTRAYRAAGIRPERAETLTRRARSAYLDHTRWRVFQDTVPMLASLQERGWRHIILSNFVPELSQLVDRLGLAPHFDAVLTSAVVGYEKPHPEAFRLGLEAAGHPDEVWMIGDNPVADVAGAEAAGIRAILVRRQTANGRSSSDLRGALRWLEPTGPG